MKTKKVTISLTPEQQEKAKRDSIDKVKNFKQFVNKVKKYDNFLKTSVEHDGTEKCEYCDYEYQTSTDKRIIDDITQLTKNGYSDAYIEAQIYGKYSRTHSISKIGELMNHIKNHLKA